MIYAYLLIGLLSLIVDFKENGEETVEVINDSPIPAVAWVVVLIAAVFYVLLWPVLFLLDVYLSLRGQDVK